MRYVLVKLFERVVFLGVENNSRDFENAKN